MMQKKIYILEEAGDEFRAELTELKKWISSLELKSPHKDMGDPKTTCGQLITAIPELWHSKSLKDQSTAHQTSTSGTDYK